MTQLDSEWALQQLRAFIKVTDQIGYDNNPGSNVVVFGTHMRGSQTEASGLAHVAEQILDRVLPTWRHEPAEPTSGKRQWAQLRDWVGRAIAQLEREEELREKLGDNAPQMDAALLHPWVWGGVVSLWRTGHFRQAVDQAAVHLNAQTQNKVGRRDVSETKLFQQVFSTDAPLPGKSRLRLMDDDGSDMFNNVHRGAMAMAEGLYAAIRNPIAHEVGAELEEQEALEQLAAFSVLARWVDRATVVTAK